ncbi:hypothetical protein MTR_8g464070 [Medicago truncatula]|uniref:Uncharacterized protein n=1 Tax=Medicago truncatula TaxID=3880 RepID=A0A072TQ87_MEDTR|nr:hypothetical protein MTR_8g464070 [Medicago truncatula]
MSFDDNKCTGPYAKSFNFNRSWKNNGEQKNPKHLKKTASEAKKLNYHPGKANVVADALSRKTLHMSAMIVREVSSQSVKLGMLKINSEFLNSITIQK